MTYETTKVKNNVKEATKNQQIEAAKGLSTSRLLFIVVARHKFGIVAAWAVIMTLVYVFPFLPDLAFTLIR